MSEMQSARLIIEIVAGVIPEQPEPEHTKRWALTTAEWETGRLMALNKVVAEALAHAHFMMMQPNRVNWVRVDWIWL